MIMNDM